MKSWDRVGHGRLFWGWRVGREWKRAEQKEESGHGGGDDRSGGVEGEPRRESAPRAKRSW